MALRLLSILLVLCSIAAKLHTAHCSSNSASSFRPEEVNYRYVTPSRNLPCSSNEPCLTLEEYASKPAYFVSNSIFYFYPGSHQLNTSLELLDVHHLYFQALNNGIVSVTFDRSVGISWMNCADISLSSIHFYVTENFAHLLVFENISDVNLSNIAIKGSHGNTNRVTVGCSAVLIKDSEANIVNSSFTGISGLYGAAMAASRSNLTFSGNATFMYNHGHTGGAILLINSSSIFTGNITFMNNTVVDDESTVTDIALCSYSNTTVAIAEALDFSGAGGAVASLCSLLTLSGHSTFVRNYAGTWGGGIFAASLVWTDSDFELGGDCSILRMSGHSAIAKNQANQIGGGISTIYCTLTFEGQVKFDNNSVNYIGGALAILGNSEVKFLVKQVSFNNNDGPYGGAMAALEASVLFSSVNKTHNCTEFYGNYAEFAGGAIGCESCTLVFETNALFVKNTASEGGAINFSDGPPWPILTLYPDYTLYFIQNHADTDGGAMFVENPSACRPSPQCFISFKTTAYSNNISLVFVNNSAGQAGSVLYGGELNKCLIYYSGNNTDCVTHGTQIYSSKAAKTFMNISHIISQGNVSDISSTTVRICFCNEHFVPNCSLSELRIPDIFPGQLFNVTLVGLGQGNHPVPSRIMSRIEDDNNYYSLNPSIQSIKALCTTIHYRSYSNDEFTTYKLYHDNPCQSLVDTGVQIDIYFLACPPGFILRDQKCDCDEWLQKFTQNCYIDNLSIERTENNFWISLDNNKTGLLLTPFGCPLDFCKNPPMNVTLNNPNSQCDFNRSGVLCGSCIDSLSIALGSLHCISCSNFYLLLCIPFALAGVALVAIILFMHLTVDVGTINGLLFYANIIQANHQAFFPRSINFFTVFISWLNLDLGIEACLYDGLTFYVYSWLQFVFPFYIWLLITLIILASHYSLTVAKYLGNFNPVAVLATLLLMSYGKILQSIITPLSWGYLTYTSPTEHHCTIWLFDGNIGFFTDHGHIILAVFAILTLVFLFLPYTFILLCGHCLQAHSHRRLLSWINKLKPFLDAYHAPYRGSCRYWTGLLLITRGGLFITFAANAVGSDSFNILAISSVALALLAIKGRAYENCYIDALESSFLLNLGIFSVATFYVRENGLGDTNQALVSSLSVGIAFVTFIGIFFFHAFCQLKETKIWKDGVFRRAGERHFIQNRNERDDQLKLELEFTSSTAQLREPLLETKTGSTNAINYGT